MTEQLIIRISNAVAGTAYTFTLPVYDEAGLLSGVSNYTQGRFQSPVKPVGQVFTLIISINVCVILFAVFVVVIAGSLWKNHSRYRDKQYECAIWILS